MKFVSTKKCCKNIHIYIYIYIYTNYLHRQRLYIMSLFYLYFIHWKYILQCCFNSIKILITNISLMLPSAYKWNRDGWFRGWWDLTVSPYPNRMYNKTHFCFCDNHHMSAPPRPLPSKTPASNISTILCPQRQPTLPYPHPISKSFWYNWRMTWV